ncbi:hypothetical protein OA84_03745 [Kaistella solincola]|uniref:Uncharacterized protein n=1 Tax=Kaistella solincola TaxID=510955 RepID=A0ABR4ZT27_9FLAO|nr:hypothetical protein OA84_03745 [Kaistella solincola]
MNSKTGDSAKNFQQKVFRWQIFYFKFFKTSFLAALRANFFKFNFGIEDNFAFENAEIFPG